MKVLCCDDISREGATQLSTLKGLQLLETLKELVEVIVVDGLHRLVPWQSPAPPTRSVAVWLFVVLRANFTS